MGQSSRVRLWQTVYSAGEGGVALGVAGAVVRQVPAVEVGAVGAEGTEGVGDDGVGQASRPGGNSGQSPLRQPSVAGLSRSRQSWWTARLQSQHQMPPMTQGFVVILDDEN